jgi:hypothetical protein
MMNQALWVYKAHFEKAGDTAKAAIATTLREPVSDATAKWDHKFQKLIIPLQAKSVGARDSALPNASDLWKVAEKDKDPSWRVTAIMWFGYLKGAKGVNEGKVNEYLDGRAKKEREKKGDLTLAAVADETKAMPAGAANDIVPVFGTNY